MDDVEAAASNGEVVIVAAGGTLSLLMADSGELRWAQPQPDGLRSVALLGDAIFVTTSAEVRALEVSTGDERWRVSGALLDPGTEKQPTLVQVASIDAPQESLVVGVDTTTGARRWEVPDAEGFLFDGVGDELVVLPFGAQVTNQQEQSTLASTLRAFDRTTGAELWSFEHEGVAVVQGVENGTSLVGTTPGGALERAVLVGRDGEIIAEWELEGAVPVLALVEGTAIVASSDAGATGYDAQSGAQRWQVAVGNVNVARRAVGQTTLRPVALATAVTEGVESLALLDAGRGQVRWQARADVSAIRYAREGTSYVVIGRANDATWHDPASGRVEARVSAPAPAVISDDPGIVWSGTTVAGIDLSKAPAD